MAHGLQGWCHDGLIGVGQVHLMHTVPTCSIIARGQTRVLYIVLWFALVLIYSTPTVKDLIVRQRKNNDFRRMTQY